MAKRTDGENLGQQSPFPAKNGGSPNTPQCAGDEEFTSKALICFFSLSDLLTCGVVDHGRDAARACELMRQFGVWSGLAGGVSIKSFERALTDASINPLR